MILSIFIVSCDAEGHLSSSIAIDSQVQEIADFYAEQGLEISCVDIKSYLTQAREKVRSDYSQGVKTSREQLVNYLLEKAVEKGDMQPSEVSDSNIDELAVKLEKLRYYTSANSIEPMLKYLVDENDIDESDLDFLLSLERQVESNGQTPEAAIDVLNQKIEEVFTISSISSEHQEALSGAMHITKAILCDGETQAMNFASPITLSQGESSLEEVNFRCEIIECLTTYEWTLAIVYVVVTVLVIILAIFTFGLSLLLTSVIAVAVWTLSTVVTCWVIDCDEPICPDGQSPFCEGSFEFNEEDRVCVNESFPSDAFLFDGCILSPRPSTGICPPGSEGQGSNCRWECFFPIPQNLGQNEDGFFQFDYSCQ